MTSNSHFVEFLDLYDNFTASPPALFAVPTSPNVENPDGPPAGKIEHKVAAKWAVLFNRRYRMLLTELALILSESAGENAGGKGLAERESLIDRAIQSEMQGDYGIRGLAKKLVTMPRRANSDAKTDAAAAPFELLPGAQELPAEPVGHRDFLATLIDQSDVAIDDLLGLTSADAVSTDDRAGLTALKAGDADLRADVVKMTFTN
jgi:hypothetical protein